jgi:uncharacterized membrane protein YphA (DoxX/SURF4 family)
VQWVSLLVRLGLAAVFLVAGGLKVGDLDASGRAVIAYELMPTNVAMTVGAVQPLVEIALGVLLMLGLATRLAAWISGVLMVIFISGIVSAWARGLNIDCGCFSKGGHLPEGQTPDYLPEILRDLFFLAMAVFLIIFPASRFSLDGWLLASNGSEGDADDE